MTYMYSIKCLALGANIPGNTRKKNQDGPLWKAGAMCTYLWLGPRSHGKWEKLKAKSEANVKDPHVSSGFSWQSKVKVRAQPRSVTWYGKKLSNRSTPLSIHSSTSSGRLTPQMSLEGQSEQRRKSMATKKSEKANTSTYVYEKQQPNSSSGWQGHVLTLSSTDYLMAVLL